LIFLFFSFFSSPRWEIRHGAALGLREILRKHILSAGRTAVLTTEEMNAKNALWLEDVALRLVIALTLDRFADYDSDKVAHSFLSSCFVCN
jgi:TATA-binding protein-associated factor